MGEAGDNAGVTKPADMGWMYAQTAYAGVSPARSIRAVAARTRAPGGQRHGRLRLGPGNEGYRDSEAPHETDFFPLFEQCIATPGSSWIVA